MAFSFFVVLFWLFGVFILDEEKWKLDKKSEQNSELSKKPNIKNSEHQKKSKKAVAIAVICRVLTSVCGT